MTGILRNQGDGLIASGAGGKPPQALWGASIVACLDDAQPKKLIHLRKAPRARPDTAWGARWIPPYVGGQRLGKRKASWPRVAGPSRTMRGASGMDSLCANRLTVK